MMAKWTPDYSRQYNRERKRAVRDAREAKGLCRRCGGERQQGYKSCRACRLKASERYSIRLHIIAREKYLAKAILIRRDLKRRISAH